LEHLLNIFSRRACVDTILTIKYWNYLILSKN
jgi:hypothetical protein